MTSIWTAIGSLYSGHEPFLYWVITLVIAAGLPYLIHRLVLFFDYPILSLKELFWHAIVSLMPQPIINMLPTTASAKRLAASTTNNAAGKYAAKSNILRNAFGLSTTASSNKEAQSDIPPGLGNWDNSCYQNSVLQSLSSLQQLGAFLGAASGGDEDTTVAALGSLLCSLNEPNNYGTRLWTPPLLKSMSSWQQQDAQEYYSKIMDSVEKDLVRQTKTQSQTASAGLQDLLSVNSRPLTGQLSHQTKAVMPLDGLLSQRVGCTSCGYVDGLSLIPFNCLTLSPGKNQRYNLEDCLDEYTALESIEGVECAKCTLQKTQLQLYQLCQRLRSERLAEDDDKSDGGSTFEQSVKDRLQAVTTALSSEDFTESTLAKTCQIPAKLRVSSTKSKQAAVMRAPRCLAVHINRSLFDEYTGALTKNSTRIVFPEILDLSRWCTGSGSSRQTWEWEMDPRLSILRSDTLTEPDSSENVYELRSIVTHYGRHENGHYICYRKSVASNPEHRTASGENDVDDGEESDTKAEDSKERWWRLSDEDVSRVSKEDVLSQGGVFMLFYERIASATSSGNPTTDTATNIQTKDTGHMAAELSSIVNQEESSESALAPDLMDDFVEPSIIPISMESPKTGMPPREWPALRTAAPERAHSSERIAYPSLPMLTT